MFSFSYTSLQSIDCYLSYSLRNIYYCIALTFGGVHVLILDEYNVIL